MALVEVLTTPHPTSSNEVASCTLTNTSRVPKEWVTVMGLVEPSPIVAAYLLAMPRLVRAVAASVAFVPPLAMATGISRERPSASWSRPVPAATENVEPVSPIPPPAEYEVPPPNWAKVRDGGIKCYRRVCGECPEATRIGRALLDIDRCRTYLRCAVCIIRAGGGTRSTDHPDAILRARSLVLYKNPIARCKRDTIYGVTVLK